MGTNLIIMATLVIGLNWTPGYAPPGETPQSSLARIGGSVYRDYNSPFSGDSGRERIRLVRYGMVFSPPHEYSPGSTWQLGNEINLIEQDNAARSFEEARNFAIWFRSMREQIKTFDPSARIIGPSVWNWDGAGSSCCVKGADSYGWFVLAHQLLYGSPPSMDYLAVQIYPWAPLYWDNPQLSVGTGLQQVSLASVFSAGRWPIVVTEWGLLRKDFNECQVRMSQTMQERYDYTRLMLEGFVARGVVLALYYGSHEQVCDGNGLMSWAIERNGNLTVEGLALRGVRPREIDHGTRVR